MNHFKKNIIAWHNQELNDGMKVEIDWDGYRLSICGGYKDSCGQNMDDLPANYGKLKEIWENYHLNDMRAGCEHQRAEKWDERPIDPTKPLNSYGKFDEFCKHNTWNMLTWVTCWEHPEGLLCKPCPTCGYKYGEAWLYEEVPEDVLIYLKSLT